MLKNYFFNEGTKKWNRLLKIFWAEVSRDSKQGARGLVGGRGRGDGQEEELCLVSFRVLNPYNLGVQEPWVPLFSDCYLTSLGVSLISSFHHSMIPKLVAKGSYYHYWLITQSIKQGIQTLNDHHRPQEWSNYSILPSSEGGPVFSGAERRLRHM